MSELIGIVLGSIFLFFLTKLENKGHNKFAWFLWGTVLVVGIVANNKNLKCTFGLVACLNHDGPIVTAQAAVSIIEKCHQISRYKVSGFKEYKLGGAMPLADIAYDEGLRFKYPDESSPYERRKVVFIACRRFEEAFNADSRWDNLEKWPW